MSPPQVTMQKPVFIEQDEQPRGSNTKKICIISSAVITSLLIIGAITFGAIAYNYRLFYKENYDTKANVDGIEVPEHIRVDYNKQIIYVTNDKNGPIDALNALHNYERKILAFYDLSVNKCFIDKLDDTFDEGLKKWSGHAGRVRVPKDFTFEYPKEPISSDVLRRFGGDEVADHCKNATSHWVLNVVPVERLNRQKRRAALAAVAYCCEPCMSGRAMA